MKSLTSRFSVNLSKGENAHRRTINASMGDCEIDSSPEKPRPLAWLIAELEQDIATEHLSHAERDNYLEQVKTYTRTAGDAAPLCTRQGVLLLCKHAFDRGTAKTSRTALKCLANIMLLAAHTRQLFVDLKYPPNACEALKHENHEDEFLGSRLLFLLTYGTTFDFEKLFTENQLIEAINSNIAKHATNLQSNLNRRRVSSVGDAANPGPQRVDLKALEAQEQLETMALADTLKLLFNLTQFYPDAKPAFSKSLVSVLKLLQRLKLASPPLQPPLIYVINALLNLDFDAKALFPAFDSKCNVDRLILVLDLSLRQESDGALERSAIPLLTLIRRIFEFAPKSIKTHLKHLLLPSDKDREKPLGQSDSLSSRLLKLSASPSAPNMAKGVQELMFEISDKDVHKFVRNIGYGFASGFLMSHNMEVPGNAFDAWSSQGRASASRIEELDSDDDGEGAAESTAEGSDKRAGSPEPTGAVNPITGQRLDSEKPAEEDPRTEDEKIREAERLFVLFERLRATGVVNIENPVAKAAREGKLE